MVHLGKKIIFLLFFIHVGMQAMKPNNPLGIADGWQGLAMKAPQIMDQVTDYFDVVSSYNFRLTCKTYAHIMDKERYDKKVDEIRDMNSDEYVKAMLFFSENSRMRQLVYCHGAEDCRAETEAIGYLLTLVNGGKVLGNSTESPVFWYQKDKQQQIFEVYKNNIQSWTSMNCGVVAIIRLILHQKGNINWQDEEGNTLLHYAKHRAHINFLLKQDAIDVNKQNNKGETPLHYAFSHPGIYKTKHSRTLQHYWDYAWILASILLNDKRTNFTIETSAKKTIMAYAIDSSLQVKNAEDVIKMLPLHLCCESVDFSKKLVGMLEKSVTLEYVVENLCNKFQNPTNSNDKKPEVNNNNGSKAFGLYPYLHSWMPFCYKHQTTLLLLGTTIVGFFGWLLYTGHLRTKYS